MNRPIRVAILAAMFGTGASWPIAADAQASASSGQPMMQPLRLALSTETKVPMPVACERDESKDAEHVIIRIGLVPRTKNLKVVPDKCVVGKGAVVTWVPDTTLSDIEVRFVKPGPNNSCKTGTIKGETPDQGSNTVFAPSNLGGIALPSSLTISDKAPTQSPANNFTYCVSAGGGAITPNPAIIITE